ncbi:ArsR/SmtB family transcription factor [Calidifontibacillus oryziterrae]|uniref:ArsR/SmtB family transcription factor n=1 Tax=Calidifontibacillus oryziterrae TaxID=1191699 RepID=UPI0002EEB7B0|nr:metalloregulator ArsR/SmtB family transcription factor [Calidifontibacillus oryziterrae]
MTSKDTCEIYCFDAVKVDRIQKGLQTEDIVSIVQLFKSLADENRAKTVYALCQDQELCVCDIANIIGASVATTSHHLRALYKQGIVKYRKEGKMAFYSLIDDHVKKIMMMAIEYKKEEKIND